MSSIMIKNKIQVNMEMRKLNGHEGVTLITFRFKQVILIDVHK